MVKNVRLRNKAKAILLLEQLTKRDMSYGSAVAFCLGKNTTGNKTSFKKSIFKCFLSDFVYFEEDKYKSPVLTRAEKRKISEGRITEQRIFKKYPGGAPKYEIKTKGTFTLKFDFKRATETAIKLQRNHLLGIIEDKDFAEMGLKFKVNKNNISNVYTNLQKNPHFQKFICDYIESRISYYGIGAKVYLRTTKNNPYRKYFEDQIERFSFNTLLVHDFFVVLSHPLFVKKLNKKVRISDTVKHKTWKCFQTDMLKLIDFAKFQTFFEYKLNFINIKPFDYRIV